MLITKRLEYLITRCLTAYGIKVTLEEVIDHINTKPLPRWCDKELYKLTIIIPNLLI